MQIFIDTANLTEIEHWLRMGVIDGVTTNPTIMLKDGVRDFEKGARQIAALVDPRPLSVEVTTNDPAEMLVQARRFASWAPNIVVKVPQVTPDGTPCYDVMSQLEADRIRVNATAAMSLGQVILSAKAGASYVSIFAGRVSDEGGDAAGLIARAADWLKRWGLATQVIVGSIRSVSDVLQAAMAGAHVITIPPLFLYKMADHKYSRETVRQFVADAEKALGLMQGVAREGA